MTAGWISNRATALGDPCLDIGVSGDRVRGFSLSISLRGRHGEAGTDPMGRSHYWVTVRAIEEVEEGTDRWAVQNGLISITPLRLDLTDHGALEETLAAERRE